MSDPTKDQAPKDDLDLEKETVRDLEPDENDADDVRGGLAKPGITRGCA